ncbi:MAG: metallophosphoesterase family protein [Myxococcales bacterium]|nr:metallophosphoesterase family protein [Myxococcales bacterium]
MRLGIFSDVHANLEALVAVVSAYRDEAIDEYYSLGDTVGYGASPNECCDIVRKLVKATVLGNHDAAVASRMDYSYYYDAARAALDYHARLLDPGHMDWLRELPYTHPLPEYGVLLSHGSPLQPEEFDYVFTEDQARTLLGIFDRLPRVTFIGHSHLCRVFALSRDRAYEIPVGRHVLDPGRKYIVSVGSVGQPRDFDNRASYTIFDTNSSVVEFRRVPYDIERCAGKIFRSPLAPNFGNRLFLGL